MPSTQVSHSVVEMVVTIADQGELSLTEVCAGLPVDERTLRRRLGGLEWALFVELIERLEARLGHARLLELCAAPPDISPIGRRLFGRFVSPRALLGFVSRVMGPAMYPMYATSFDETTQEDSALVARLTLRLENGLRGSRTVFDLHGAAMAGLPSFIGLAPFPMRAEVTDRGGDYSFELSPPMARLGRRDRATEALKSN